LYNGQAIEPYNVSFSDMDAYIASYMSSLTGIDGAAAQNGAQAQPSSLEEKVVTSVSLAVDTHLIALDGAKALSKGAVAGMKTYIKSAGLVGAAIGGAQSAYNIYESFSEGKTPSWNDWVGLGLGIVSGIVLATPGVGEAAEGITLALDAATTVNDVISASNLH
jgi:hypothetical protein